MTGKKDKKGSKTGAMVATDTLSDIGKGVPSAQSAPEESGGGGFGGLFRKEKRGSKTGSINVPEPPTDLGKPPTWGGWGGLFKNDKKGSISVQEQPADLGKQGKQPPPVPAPPPPIPASKPPAGKTEKLPPPIAVKGKKSEGKKRKKCKCSSGKKRKKKEASRITTAPKIVKPRPSEMYSKQTTTGSKGVESVRVPETKFKSVASTASNKDKNMPIATIPPSVPKKKCKCPAEYKRRKMEKDALRITSEPRVVEVKVGKGLSPSAAEMHLPTFGLG